MFQSSKKRLIYIHRVSQDGPEFRLLVSLKPHFHCNYFGTQFIDEHFDNRTVGNAFDGMNKNENEVLLECSEDVPFSPLRQSYTPLPTNQFNGSDTDEIITADEIPSDGHSLNADNDLQIIDIKLNEQELLDDANDDDEQPTDENINMSISKENVVLFTINASGDGEHFFFHLVVLILCIHIIILELERLAKKSNFQYT